MALASGVPLENRAVTIDPVPRVLDASERRVLDRPLSVDFVGVEALRVQSSMVLGQRACRCGCASLDLVVAQSAPLAHVTERVPVSAAARLPEPIGAVEILLFLDGGQLSLMEIASDGDQVPARWPDPGTLVIDAR